MRSILTITFLTLILAFPARAADYPMSVRPGSEATKPPSNDDLCAKQCHRTGVAQRKCLCLCTGGIWHPSSRLCE
jgi:hypothetical protein